jgi:hypothetical protein
MAGAPAPAIFFTRINAMAYQATVKNTLPQTPVDKIAFLF